MFVIQLTATERLTIVIRLRIRCSSVTSLFAGCFWRCLFCPVKYVSYAVGFLPKRILERSASASGKDRANEASMQSLIANTDDPTGT